MQVFFSCIQALQVYQLFMPLQQKMRQDFKIQKSPLQQINSFEFKMIGKKYIMTNEHNTKLIKNEIIEHEEVKKDIICCNFLTKLLSTFFY